MPTSIKVKSKTTSKLALSQPKVPVQGTKDEVQGTKDEVQGTKDEVQGTKDEVQGTKDEVQGTKDEVQGTKDQGSNDQDIINELLDTTPTLDQKISEPFSVPKSLFTGFTEVLRQQQLLFAKNVADKFNIDYNDLVEKCFSDQPLIEITEPAPKKAKKAKKDTITDYTQAQTLKDLQCFKSADLKAILEENDIATTGTKLILMARVWGIQHPEDAPVESKKKRGRPSKPKSPNTVTNSKEDTEECELDPEKMPDFFVDSENAVQPSKTSDTTTYKLLKKKYIFLEGEDEMEFKGFIEEDENISWTEDIPDDLLKMLGMEE